ncbi:hypothetical protein FZEAL_10717, partial [Fusarium zealandicum]
MPAPWKFSFLMALWLAAALVSATFNKQQQPTLSSIFPKPWITDPSKAGGYDASDSGDLEKAIIRRQEDEPIPETTTTDSGDSVPSSKLEDPNDPPNPEETTLTPDDQDSPQSPTTTIAKPEDPVPAPEDPEDPEQPPDDNPEGPSDPEEPKEENPGDDDPEGD